PRPLRRAPRPTGARATEPLALRVPVATVHATRRGGGDRRDPRIRRLCRPSPMCNIVRGRHVERSGATAHGKRHGLRHGRGEARTEGSRDPPVPGTISVEPEPIPRHCHMLDDANSLFSATVIPPTRV